MHAHQQQSSQQRKNVAKLHFQRLAVESTPEHTERGDCGNQRTNDIARPFDCTLGLYSVVGGIDRRQRDKEYEGHYAGGHGQRNHFTPQQLRTNNLTHDKLL